MGQLHNPVNVINATQRYALKSVSGKLYSMYAHAMYHNLKK